MSKKKNAPHPKPKPSTPQYAQRDHTKTGAPAPSSAFWQENKTVLIVLSLLAIILYAPSIGYGFVLDDAMVIKDNQFTQKGFAGIADIFNYESFRGFFGSQTQYLEGDRYRPLSIATFAAEVGLFGTGKSAIGHFFNILLYALTAVLMYRVLLFMFPVSKTDIASLNTEREQKSEIWKLKSEIFSVPFIATALFIVHPLHVEVVANIKGRDEILALLGEFGALYFTFKYAANQQTKYLIGAFITFTLGIFSKESAITFLAIVPLTAHFFIKATTAEKLKMTAPIIAGTILYLAARLHAIGYLIDAKEVTDLMNNPFYGMGLGDKLATIFYTFLLYFKLHVFPHPLTHDYYPYHIPKMSWGDWQVILSLVLNIGLVTVILRGWRSRSVWAYAAAFYLLALSIVSNLVVSVGIFMNERFVYHASFGFCLAVAYLFVSVFGGEKKLRKVGSPTLKTLGIAIAALFIIGFAIRTWLREPDWKDGHTLNKSALIHSPNSARANCFYAIALWESEYMKLPAEDINHARRRPLLDTMQHYFSRSLEILPNYSSGLKMWAGIAAEYYKIDGNLDNLLTAFERVHHGKGYDKFTIDYLQYVNSRVVTKAEADKLIAFYEKEMAFAKTNYSTTPMPAAFEKLLGEVRQF